MPTIATEAPARLPTVDELLAARDTVQAAVEAINKVRWAVWRIARPVRDEEKYERDLRDEVPKLEEIGRLYVFVQYMRDRLDEAGDDVNGLDEMLEDLDVLRVVAGAGIFSDEKIVGARR